MGIAEADLDADGFPEYALSSMGDTKLQRLDTVAADDEGRPAYDDVAFELGATAHRPYAGGDHRPSTGWHAAFADLNNDARTDLYIAKGNVENMNDFAAHDPDNLLLGDAGGRFVERGEPPASPRGARGRGAAVVDLNADGLLDLAVVNRASPMALFRNTRRRRAGRPGRRGGNGRRRRAAARTRAGGNWLAVELRQDGVNPDAIGARLSVRTGNRVQARRVSVGGGHASGALGFVHVGLGVAERATLRVQWPDGEWSAPYRLFANRHVVVDARRARCPRQWFPPAPGRRRPLPDPPPTRPRSAPRPVPTGDPPRHVPRHRSRDLERQDRADGRRAAHRWPPRAPTSTCCASPTGAPSRTRRSGSRAWRRRSRRCGSKQKKAFAAVRGIGLSGHMHGATLVDAADEVIRPCMLWNDTRAHAEAARLDTALAHPDRQHPVPRLHRAEGPLAARARAGRVRAHRQGAAAQGPRAAVADRRARVGDVGRVRHRLARRRRARLGAGARRGDRADDGADAVARRGHRGVRHAAPGDRGALRAGRVGRRRRRRRRQRRLGLRHGHVVAPGARPSCRSAPPGCCSRRTGASCPSPRARCTRSATRCPAPGTRWA